MGMKEVLLEHGEFRLGVDLCVFGLEPLCFGLISLPGCRNTAAESIEEIKGKPDSNSLSIQAIELPKILIGHLIIVIVSCVQIERGHPEAPVDGALFFKDLIFKPMSLNLWVVFKRLFTGDQRIIVVMTQFIRKTQLLSVDSYQGGKTDLQDLILMFQALDTLLEFRIIDGELEGIRSRRETTCSSAIGLAFYPVVLGVLFLNEGEV